MARLDASQVVDDSRMSLCRGLGLPLKLKSATKSKLSEPEPLGYKKSGIMLRVKETDQLQKGFKNYSIKYFQQK